MYYLRRAIGNCSSCSKPYRLFERLFAQAFTLAKNAGFSHFCRSGLSQQHMATTHAMHQFVVIALCIAYMNDFGWCCYRYEALFVLQKSSLCKKSGPINFLLTPSNHLPSPHFGKYFLSFSLYYHSTWTSLSSFTKYNTDYWPN